MMLGVPSMSPRADLVRGRAVARSQDPDNGGARMTRRGRPSRRPGDPLQYRGPEPGALRDGEGEGSKLVVCSGRQPDEDTASAGTGRPAASMLPTRRLPTAWLARLGSHVDAAIRPGVAKAREAGRISPFDATSYVPRANICRAPVRRRLVKRRGGVDEVRPSRLDLILDPSCHTDLRGRASDPPPASSWPRPAPCRLKGRRGRARRPPLISPRIVHRRMASFVKQPVSGLGAGRARRRSAAPRPRSCSRARPNAMTPL